MLHGTWMSQQVQGETLSLLCDKTTHWLGGFKDQQKFSADMGSGIEKTDLLPQS